MLLGIIGQFNWVDLAIIILFIRICYIAFRSELPVELFKLAGVICAIYISMHYYTGIADFFRQRIGMKEMPLEFLDFISFAFLAIIGMISFLLLRVIFWRMVRIEAINALNKWGSLLIGIIRGFFLVGILSFALTISSVSYLRDSVGYSYLGNKFFRVAPSVYTWLWDTVASKFMVGEKFNSTVLEVRDAFYKK
jgi:uncharacterized membrane protein required for colicin V production